MVLVAVGDASHVAAPLARLLDVEVSSGSL
jgi:hypothetical protein